MKLKCSVLVVLLALLVLCAMNWLSFPIDNSEAKEKSLSTSISDMVQLLSFERDLIDIVDSYVAALQTKVDTLKQ